MIALAYVRSDVRCDLVDRFIVVVVIEAVVFVFLGFAFLLFLFPELIAAAIVIIFVFEDVANVCARFYARF